MDAQTVHDTNLTAAWLEIRVQDGRLTINANLPLRWTLVIIGALATASNSPTIIEVVTNLLRAK